MLVGSEVYTPRWGVPHWGVYVPHWGVLILDNQLHNGDPWGLYTPQWDSMNPNLTRSTPKVIWGTLNVLRAQVTLVW
jgi:hypothetical protein